MKQTLKRYIHVSLAVIDRGVKGGPMLWVSLTVIIAISFALRVYVNRGQTWGTPDEKRYSMHAYSWRPGKVFTDAIEAFITKEALEIPPTRYAFFAVAALVNRRKKDWTQCFRPMTWIAAVCGALTAPVAFLMTLNLPSSLLVASAPLSLFLSRRALQDTFTGLFLVFALLGLQLGNPWLLGAATSIALASREAVVLYLPALFVAWLLRTSGHWPSAAITLSASVLATVVGYYAIGGRKLVAVFRKLKQPTDYVRRFQSGMPHRVLTDLALVSPVTLIAALVGWQWMPLWLVGFLGAAILVHAFVTPKNVRFLLIVDLGMRIACAWLPDPWPWVVLVVSSVSDFFLYKAFGKVEDPVTANLVMKCGMYLEK